MQRRSRNILFVTLHKNINNKCKILRSFTTGEYSKHNFTGQLTKCNYTKKYEHDWQCNHLHFHFHFKIQTQTPNNFLKKTFLLNKSFRVLFFRSFAACTRLKSRARIENTFPFGTKTTWHCVTTNRRTNRQEIQRRRCGDPKQTERQK